MKTARIVFKHTDHPYPLYCKYPGQCTPQPAHVTLDTRTGEIDCDYDSCIGGGRSFDIYNGIVLRWRVNCHLCGSQITEKLEELKSTMQIILNGSDVVWDGSNWIGKIITEEAQNCCDKLDNTETLWQDIESNLITDLADWLQMGGRSTWMPFYDENVTEFIENFDLDGYTATENIAETLIDLWCEELYSGRALPQNVAQYLLDGKYCEDSAWMEELIKFSEGQIPN